MSRAWNALGVYVTSSLSRLAAHNGWVFGYREGEADKWSKKRRARLILIDFHVASNNSRWPITPAPDA